MKKLIGCFMLCTALLVAAPYPAWSPWRAFQKTLGPLFAVFQVRIPGPGGCVPAVVTGGGPWTIANTAVTGTLCRSGGNMTVCASAPFASAMTPGSTLIAPVFVASPVTVTVSDLAGNTYADCGGGKAVWYGTQFNEAFCANNASSISGNVITMTGPSGALYWPQTNAVELTGGQSPYVVDPSALESIQNAVTGSGANNMATPAGLTTANGDFVLAYFAANGGTFSAGSSPGTWTWLTSGYGPQSEYYIQPTAGPIAATETTTASGVAYGGIMVALKH